MKKKVHILAHSHWDREWYMPYEQHRMRLVELFDDLFDLFENDPDFHSFHLDGQTLPLDDYLEVKPQNRSLIEKYIQAGKLKIGPFYILQDAFLTSSESNARNMLIGFEETRKWGVEPVKLGYFPDTFGNMAQTPQLMKEVGLDIAAFGRGVKTTGFNNMVAHDEKYTSQFSEMWWEGPDQTKILGLLFANWYSNGNEIPATADEAKKFWDQKLADAEKYASTKHLLMMNGCDHQPVQKDLSQAIKLANELYPDYEFVHTDFETYLKEMQQEIPAEIGTIAGELTSQETEGWYTLANTASARVYLKQMNTQVAKQLENIAEPLATMAYEDKYPHDLLQFAWKTYMQNHPHDSICGCSVDEVHREMITRFEKANEVGKYVASEALEALTSQIDTSNFPKGAKPFIVFNTTGSWKTGTVEVEVEWKRVPFSQRGPWHAYPEMRDEKLPEFAVMDAQGKWVKAQFMKRDTRFGYDLPKDGFRQPFIATYVTIQLALEDVAPMSWQAFALVEAKTPELAAGICSTNGLENEYLKVTVHENGQLTVVNKETGIQYENLLTFEDVGDIGNEYIFFQPTGEQPLYSTEGKSTVEILNDNELVGELLLTTEMEIPVSADERLEEEQRGIIGFNSRKAKRSKTLAPIKLQTTIKLEKGSRQLKFETTFDNQMKDHRWRVLFPTGIVADTHEADSIFEVVTRPNTVSEHWQNPTNPQHQHAFVNIHNEKHGVTVANFGLNEYEILNKETIAVTLLRCVGELGDWGWFPTPEAQCLGRHTAQYAISFHGEADKLRTYHEAMSFQVPFTVGQTDIHGGKYKGNHQYLNTSNHAYALTAFKRKRSGELVTRGYNMTLSPQPFAVKIAGLQPQRANILEEVQEATATELKPAEIVTHLWK